MHKFTDEERGEITADYRQAKCQSKQIGILAELHACTEEDIRKVLHLPVQNGHPVHERVPPETRKALAKEVLLDGETVSDAAERFGLNYKTAYNIIYQARKKQQMFAEFNSAPAAKPELIPQPGPTAETPPEQPPARDPLQDTVNQMRRGLDGLTAFIDAFVDTGALGENARDRLVLWQVEARAFMTGVEYARKAGKQ